VTYLKIQIIFDFKLLDNKYIIFSQVLSPLLILLFIVLFVYESSNIVLFLGDEDKNTNNTINVGGTAEVNRDGAEALARIFGFLSLIKPML
jgi:hypothetical protein